MAAGKRHDVLCVSCNKAVTTLYDYPERACGKESSVALGEGLTHVSCTREPGNTSCGEGVHYDEFHKVSFKIRIPVRKGSWGNTGRV